MVKIAMVNASFQEEREKIKLLLLKIPEKVLSRIETIKVDHESGPTRLSGEPIRATYDLHTKIITIYATPSDPKYPCCLYHEIGHCIFHEFQEVARTAKTECQKGKENEVESLLYGDVEEWASEFCANAYEICKSEQLANGKERYQAMIDY